MLVLDWIEVIRLFGSVYLTIAGILITVATVVYSFCLSKRERLVEAAEKKKLSTTADYVLIRRINVLQKNLDRLRRILRNSTIGLCISFILFLVDSFLALQIVHSPTWVLKTASFVSICFTVFILFFFIRLFIDGFRKIDTTPMRNNRKSI